MLNCNPLNRHKISKKKCFEKRVSKLFSILFFIESENQKNFFHIIKKKNLNGH